MPARWRAAFAAAVIVSAVSAVSCVSGCGWRTDLTVDPPATSGDGGGADSARDGGARDTGPRDTGPRDTGPRDTGADTGARDTGVTSRCAADRGCDRGTRCIADVSEIGEDMAQVPLVCGEALPGGPDGAFCEDAADCDRGLCVLAGTCVAPCIDVSDCALGQRCMEVRARTSARSLQPYMGCVAVHDAPAHVRASATPIRLSRGDDMVSLPRPPEAGPTTWVLEMTGTRRVDAVTLTASDGEILFDLEALLTDGTTPTNALAFGAAPLTMLLPNSPRAIPPAVTSHELGVLVERRGDGSLIAFATDGRRRQRLDVDLFYVGGGGWRPAGSRGPRPVARALSEAESVLGVEFAEVRQHEFVGETLLEFSVLEEAGEGGIERLPDLFRLSAGAGRPSISLFFVRLAGQVLGSSGGIPGPAPMHGTDGSGIVISVEAFDHPEAPSLGNVIAHELGHYLGLFHTTELNGLVLEPLADTDECPIENDADGDGVLLPSECRRAGDENLMFWSGGGVDVSSDQRQVVERSPVLR